MKRCTKTGTTLTVKDLQTAWKVLGGDEPTAMPFMKEFKKMLFARPKTARKGGK